MPKGPLDDSADRGCGRVDLSAPPLAHVVQFGERAPHIGSGSIDAHDVVDDLQGALLISSSAAIP
ncbi:MAG TPA: hypothetical protein VLL25_09770 [Acidimicrobiales bacterium]|nr:hypothetical protein [Acidimicrobiales bacterium]